MTLRLMLLIASVSMLASALIHDNRENVAQSARRADEVISLSEPMLNDARPVELAYVDDERLIVVRWPDAPLDHRVFILNLEGETTGEWPKPPQGLRWGPETVAVDRDRDRLFFSFGEWPVNLFDTTGGWLGGWRAPTASDVWPRKLRVGPDGSVFGLKELSGQYEVHRWDKDGAYRGSWDTAPGILQTFDDVTVDDLGRVLLSNVRNNETGQWTTIKRFTERGLLIDTVDLTWPVSLGPPPEGQNPNIAFQNFTADLGRSSLLVYHVAGKNHAQHVLRYDIEGEFQDAHALWRLIPHYHPHAAHLAPHPDNGYAIVWTPDSRVQLDTGEDRGVSQFDGQGRLRAVTRMSLGGGKIDETWARVRLTGDREHTVLYPHAGIIGSVGGNEELSWTRQAPPFTMDIARADDGGVVARGWDGQDGRITLWNIDKSTAWSRPCDCPLSTGVAIDEARVYISDPISRRVLALNRNDGSSGGILQPSNAPLGWPVDVASSRRDHMVTVDQGGHVTLWQWVGNSAIELRSWRTRSGHEPIAVGAAAGLIAVLHHGGEVELWSEEARLVDRWPTTENSGANPVDVSVNDEGTVAVVDAAVPAVNTYTMKSDSPTEVVKGQEGGGRCAVEGDKVAAPSRVQVGGEVSITLTIKGDCPAGHVFADVILAWDPSSMFWYDYEYARAVEAIQQLVGALSSPSIRVGVVGSLDSSQGASVLVPLGTDAVTAAGMLGSLIRYDFEEVARVQREEAEWPDLIGPADQHLAEAGRSGALPVIVLLGRGWLPDTSKNAANEFRARNGELLALILPYLCMPCLEGTVSDADDVVHGAHANDVANIARRIRAMLTTGSIRDVQIDDLLALQTSHVSGSTRPPAAESPRRLIWELDEIGRNTQTLTYRVSADEVGRYVTNEEAIAHYTDADGIRRSYRFPQPVIEVYSPTHTPPPASVTITPSPSTTPSPTTTRIPSPVYLPLLLAEVCKPETRKIDMMLIIDASLSMLEPIELGSARNKLQAAQEAGAVMLDMLKLGDGDQVSIVAFNSEAQLLAPLTSTRSVLDRALASVTAAPQTCVVCGLEVGNAELASARHIPSNGKAMVLLTDGRASPRPASDAITEAGRSKALGTWIYTVGLGADADEETLKAIASSPNHYRYAPTGDALAQIYRDIAIELPCPRASFFGGR